MADDDTTTEQTDDQKLDPAVTDDPPNDDPVTDPFDEARARATIEAQRKAEKEAKRKASELERELKALREKEQAREDAEKSELERAQARADAAEKAAEAATARIRETETRSAVYIAATKLNIIDVDAAYTLLDKDAIEYDDDGKPANVDSALKSLIDAKPYLVKPEDTKNGVPSSPKTSNSRNRDEVFKQAKEELAQTGRYGF